LALYIFVPFIFWEKIIPKKNDKKALVIQILIFSVLIITLIFLKLFIHTIAGVLWWMPNNWYGSFIFNLPIYGVTLAFVLPISILVYQPMQKLIISRI
jgi:hypothetical protein